MKDFLKTKIAKIIRVFLDDPIEEQTINNLLGLKEWVPGLKEIKVHFIDDALEISINYLLQSLMVNMSFAARITGLKITPDEKILRLVPQGVILASTECHQIQISFKKNSKLAEEWGVFISFLPDEIKKAIEVEKDCLALHFHRFANLNDAINNKASREILGKNISIFDYVTIENVEIKPGEILIITS